MKVLTRDLGGTSLAPQPLILWLRYVASQKWQAGNLDEATYHAALRGASLAISRDLIRIVVAKLIRRAGDSPKSEKIDSQIARAYQHVHGNADVVPGKAVTGQGKKFPKKQRVEFSPSALENITSTVHVGDPEQFLVDHSPLDVNLDSGAILFLLYKPGEQVLLFEDIRSQGEYMWRRDLHPDQQYPLGGKDGAWFLVNPVDGNVHANPRQGGRLSRRSEEAVTSFRFAVLESDKADTDQWLKFLIQLNAPIVAIYYSGGRSVHALLRVDAESKRIWDEYIGKLKPILTRFGADPAALTAVRLSRLPQAWRGERQQRLIYLNPEADGAAILQSPRRGANSPLNSASARGSNEK